MADNRLLTRTLIALADTLVDDFDVIDLLTVLVDRSAEILETSAAGLMIAAPEGDLRLAASSSEALRLVEVFELQAHEGPCLDCYTSGEPVSCDDLELAVDRWPSLVPVALGAGFRSVHAFPMRLRGTVLGALNVFDVERGGLSGDDVVAAQALADIGSISILQNRAALEAQRVNEQLNLALASRVVLEQAKGVVAERSGVDITTAFDRLRGHARRNNLRLSDVAQDVVDGRLTDV